MQRDRQTDKRDRDREKQRVRGEPAKLRDRQGDRHVHCNEERR